MKKRKLKKEEMEKMADLNLDKVLYEISKIDSPRRYKNNSSFTFGNSSLKLCKAL